MRQAKRVRLQAILVVLLGGFALLSEPRQASAQTTTCYRTCIDAIVGTSCPKGQTAMCTTDSWLCDPPFLYVGTCANDS